MCDEESTAQSSALFGVTSPSSNSMIPILFMKEPKLTCPCAVESPA